ncbi:sensor histidine kinase [candidate division TA06 bacterium]|nr:sensor histidine kinase [candidate division TA06 bacterium]
MAKAKITPPARTRDRTRWQLIERIKELTALHQTAGILREHQVPAGQTVKKILDIIPPAWQYPEITGARIRYGGREYATANFRATRWTLRREFKVDRRKSGSIEVCYLKRRPDMDQGPFLAEELALVETLAELLRLYFHGRLYREALERMNRRLEHLVQKRTAQLAGANLSLRREAAARQRQDIQLRNLASELVLAEARERRAIAGDLHDHIGQALALVRRKLQVLQGYSAFSGSEREVESIRDLIDQIIQYTRTLTVELSPPVLYELGLGPALASLAGQFRKKHGLAVTAGCEGLPPDLGDDAGITLYTAARELLANVVKHSGAKNAWLTAGAGPGTISITVRDDGSGCPPLKTACDGSGFGLFSIRERLKRYGGTLSLESLPGKGTSATITMPLKPNKEKQ